MTEFIADGKFMALRAEAQETNMLLREILKALQSSNAQAEPAQQGLVRKPPPTPKVPKEAVGKATVETVEEVDTGKADAAEYLVPSDRVVRPAKADDSAKADPWNKTEPVEMATRAPSPQDEQGAQPPAVPKRGQTLTGQAETGSRGR